MTTLFLALLLVAGVAAATPVIDGIVSPGEYPQSLSLEGGAVTVSWSFEGSSGAFAISARTAGWVALGFGATTGMEGADMAIGFAAAGAAGQVLDCYSTGLTGPHPSDADQGGGQSLAESAVLERDGVTVMEIRRPLAAGEATDKPVAPGDRFLWAIGGEDDPYSFHEAAGVGVLAGAGGSAAPGAASGRLRRVLPHALPLSLSFLLMASGMLVARYGKKNKRWLSIHKPLGITAAFLGIVGLGLGIRMVALGSGIHLRVPHTWIGVAALISAVGAPLLGQGMFWAKKGKAAIRKAHRWAGRAAILLMVAAIVMGLVQARIFG